MNRIVFLITCILSSTTAFTQSGLHSAGGSCVGDNFIIDWTLGEVAVITIDGDGFAATQGQQQPQKNEFQVDPIPTLGDWGLIILMICFLFTGTVSIRNHSTHMYHGVIPKGFPVNRPNL